MSLTLDIIRQLPKADLHCHLDGFCRPETIVELAKEQDVKLPTEDLEELKKILTAPFDCPDLPTYLRCFDAPLDVMQFPYAITRIFYEACEDAVKDGITYLELRFAPALHTRNGHSYSQILQAAIDGVRMAEIKLPITVRIICCAMRHHSPEVNKQVADVCWRFRHSGVVAFDLAGPEYGFPPDKHIAAFRIMREKSVSLTIHAGEAFGAKSVELALKCNANRIGHGTRIVEDERVLQTVIDRRIPLEMCVTSNCQTKAVEKIEDHPIKKLFDIGVLTVPCTDNPTVSGCTLSGEYLMLQEKFGFNVEQLVRMMDYGFRSAFVDETLKRRLRIEAITKTLRILKENNIDISPIIANAIYYTPIGVSLPNKFTPPCKVPEITLDFVKQIKKADTDTRFVGSVPLQLLYKFYTEQEEKERLEKFESFEQFKKFCVCIKQDPNHIRAKALACSLLQTENNIRAATKAILAEAVQDNIEYMELTFSPIRHTTKGLKSEQVLDFMNEEIEKYSAINKIQCCIVISVNVSKDSPLVVQEMAELCVAYKDKNVVGFATNTQELDATTMPFFQPTFDYLRDNFVSVSIFAGEQHAKSIPIAIVRGNTRRISGAFQVTESCALLNEITSHNISVLAIPTPRMSAAVDNCFAANPIRSFFDFGVKIAYCSIHNSFSGKSRSEQLFEICKESGLDSLDLIKMMSYTYGAIFQHYADIKKYQNRFWEESNKILKDNGYTRFLNPIYFTE
jgi:adenosine deaminase